MRKQCQKFALSSTAWLRESLRSCICSCCFRRSTREIRVIRNKVIPTSSVHRVYPMDPVQVLDLSHDAVEELVKEPVTSFQVSAGSSKGDNVSSDLFRLIVTLKSGLVRHLVYKKFPSGAEQRQYSVSGQIFWRERLFYSDVIPQVSRLLANEDQVPAGVRHEHVTRFKSLFPPYVGGFNDDEQDFICLEDLRPEGFKMPDKYSGLTWEETEMAMGAIGKFHAYSYIWCSKVPNWTEGPEMKRFLNKHWIGASEHDSVEDEQVKGFLRDNYVNTIELVKKHGEGLDASDLAEKMSRPDFMQKTQEIMAVTTNSTGDKYFPLLIHGDLWANNLLYRYGKTGKPEEIKILDLQFARKGNIFEDLSYFIYTSTSPKLRKEHSVTEILRIYYDNFTKTLTDFSIDEPLGFSHDRLVEQFKENDLATFLFSSFFLPLQLGKDAEDGEVRATDYAEELINKMERSPVALKRLEELAREAVENGVI